MIIANPKYFSTWSHGKNAAGTGKSRHDYDCTEHLIDEMLHEGYFGPVLVDLEPRDEIHVVDGANQRATFVVDWKDAHLRTVGFSILEHIVDRPVAGEDGLAIKYRGPRGGFWCVMDQEANVIDSGHRTREEAERARDVLRSTDKRAA